MRSRFASMVCRSQDEADAARAEGTTVLAVGVGSAPSEETLLAIAGSQANIFDVDDFTELNGELRFPTHLMTDA